MRSEVSSPLALTATGHGIQAFARRQAGRAAGLGLFAFVAFGLAALGTWNVADPSFSHATDNPVTNAMGYPGAVFCRPRHAVLRPAVGRGPGAGRHLGAVPGHRARRRPHAQARRSPGSARHFWPRRSPAASTPPPTWPLPTGLGGVFGDMVLKVPALFIGGYPTGMVADRARRAA